MSLVHMIDSGVTNPFLLATRAAWQPAADHTTALLSGGPSSACTYTHRVVLKWLKTWLQLLLSRILQFIICTVSTKRHARARTNTQHRFLPQNMACGNARLSSGSAPLGLEHAALRWNGPALALRRGFGRPPRAVSWMVAPSLHSPNVHTWLQGSYAMVKASTHSAWA